MGVTVAKKTLGIYLCPTGDASEQIRSILEKAHEWIARAKESKLKRRDL